MIPLKRIVIGFAVAAAVVASAAPASAHYRIKYCMPTNPYPCGICVTEGPVDDCT